jgi:hypothetical protein
MIGTSEISIIPGISAIIHVWIIPIPIPIIVIMQPIRRPIIPPKIVISNQVIIRIPPTIIHIHTKMRIIVKIPILIWIYRVCNNTIVN